MWTQKQLSLIIEANETSCKITIESEAWFDNGQKQRIMNFESVFGIYGFDWKITAIFQKRMVALCKIGIGQERYYFRKRIANVVSVIKKHLFLKDTVDFINKKKLGLFVMKMK